MADHSDTNADGELERILNRVDQLPVRDNRSPEEIIDYDGTGLPAPLTPSTPPVAVRDTTDSSEYPDMEDWRKAFGDNIPPAVKEFLQYRHREWELGMEPDLKARQEARAARAQKP